MNSTDLSVSVEFVVLDKGDDSVDRLILSGEVVSASSVVTEISFKFEVVVSSLLGEDRVLDDSSIRAGVLSVDLKRHGDVSGDDLSDDNSTSLVQGVEGSKDGSMDSGLIDRDDSSRSKNVVDDGSRNSGEGVSSDVDVLGSNDVDGPVGLNVAVIDGGVSVESHLSRSQSEVVVLSFDVIASDEESREGDRLLDVISVRGDGVLESLVAGLSSVEVRVKASSRSTRSSSSSLDKVVSSVEGSSNEHILSVSRVWKSSSVRVDRSRSPSNVSSSNKRVRKRVISVSRGSLKFVSDGVSISNSDVVLGSKSSFDISSVGNEVVEGDDVEVLEGIDSISKREVKSSANSLPSGAGRGLWWRWRRRLAEDSVDLMGSLNVSNDDESLDDSRSRLVVSVKWTKDGSSDFSVDVDGSFGSKDVVKNLL